MIDDSDVQKIADAVRLSRISKTWKDPKKAAVWGELGWVLFILTVVFVVVIYFAGNDFFIHDDQEAEYIKNSIHIMDCQSLKTTLLSLNADESIVYNKILNDIKTEIIGRC